MGNCGSDEAKPPPNASAPTQKPSPQNEPASQGKAVLGSYREGNGAKRGENGYYGAKSRDSPSYVRGNRRASAVFKKVNLKTPPRPIDIPAVGKEVVIYGQRNEDMNGRRGTVLGFENTLAQVRIDSLSAVHNIASEFLLSSKHEVASFYADDCEVRFFVTHENKLLRWVQGSHSDPQITTILALSYRHNDRRLRDHNSVGVSLRVGDWRRVVNLLAPQADRCGVGHNLPTREIRIDGWWRIGAAVSGLWEDKWHPGHIAKSRPDGQVDILWDEDGSLTPTVPPGHVRPWMRADCTLDPNTQEVTHEPSLLFSPHLDFNDIYATGKKLGEGGFGEVYDVVHKETGIPYAAKVLPVSHGTKDEVREVIASRREPVVVGTKVQSLSFQDLDPKLTESSQAARRGSDARARTVSGFVVSVGDCPYGETGWVGVVLDVAVGTHNGTVDGVHYFDAPHNRGAFVKVALCRPVRPHVTEVWGGLNHPHICKLIDWRSGRHVYTPHGYPDWKNEEVYGQESENYMVCVMTHCPGGDLETLLKSPSFKHIFIGENAAALIMKQILSALEHLHANGILHHDLKVSNVLLDQPYSGGSFNPTIKLCDFGLSRYIGDGEVGGGTLLYMAPELLLAWRWRPNAKWSRQWKDAAAAFGVKRDITKEAPSYDQKVDVFAAGVVCYSVMTRGRRHPFRLEGSWANLPESEHLLHLAESINKGVQFPETPWGRVSDDCKNFVSTLLCANATDRPTAAEALRHPWIVKNTPASGANGSTTDTLWADNGQPSSPRENDAASLGVVSKFKNMKLRETPQGKGPPKGLPQRRDQWRRGAVSRPVVANKLLVGTARIRSNSREKQQIQRGVNAGGPSPNSVNTVAAGTAAANTDQNGNYCTPANAYTPKLPPKHTTRAF